MTSPPIGKNAKLALREWPFMWQVSIGLKGLCLFAVLVGCSVDLTGLRDPTDSDAGMSPDTVRDSDRTADAGEGPGSGGRGGAGSGTDGSGGAGPEGTKLTVDAGRAGGAKADLDGAVDGARTTYDSSGPDRTTNSGIVPDLGTGRYDTGGKAQGDANCLNTDCVPFIVPSSPAAMKCNLDGSTTELSWTDLSTWEPTRDSRLCSNAGAYSIQGSIAQFKPGLLVLAEVYASEDSTWHPISGGPTLQPDSAGGFNGSFCLPQKGLDRTFRFRIVQKNTSQDAGVACLIHVRRE